jgi:hypothetical protein
MADGGNVEFVEIDGPVVFLRLAGACGSCPSSITTMTMGIKRRLMERIPVRGVRGVCVCGVGKQLLGGGKGDGHKDGRGRCGRGEGGERR